MAFVAASWSLTCFAVFSPARPPRPSAARSEPTSSTARTTTRNTPAIGRGTHLRAPGRLPNSASAASARGRPASASWPARPGRSRGRRCSPTAAGPGRAGPGAKRGAIGALALTMTSTVFLPSNEIVLGTTKPQIFRSSTPMNAFSAFGWTPTPRFRRPKQWERDGRVDDVRPAVGLRLPRPWRRSPSAPTRPRVDEARLAPSACSRPSWPGPGPVDRARRHTR